MMDSLERRGQVFIEVRDLPYHIAVEGEADACCATKSFMLQRRLASLGLGSVFSYGTFLWSQLNLPPEILRLLPGDEGWHQWLRVFIPETQSWVDVDASWDAGLGTIFPTAAWDGRTSTNIGVPLHRRCSDEESAAITAAGYQPEAVDTYMRAHRPFLSALNGYLASVRGQGPVG